MTTADSPEGSKGARCGRWRLALERSPHAPARARREIAQLGLGPRRSDDLALLVSEAVTNAVRHGGADGDGYVVVEVSAGPRRIHVRVVDGGRSMPAQRQPGLDGGYGLHLVEALAERWGVAPGEIWFELPVAARA